MTDGTSEYYLTEEGYHWPRISPSELVAICFGYSGYDADYWFELIADSL